MEDCKTVSILLVLNEKLKKKWYKVTYNKIIYDMAWYRKLVRILIYLSNAICSNVLFAMNALNQFNEYSFIYY